MATAPPIARDRLIGLAGVSPNLVRSMEIYGRIPPQMGQSRAMEELQRVAHVLRSLADIDFLRGLRADALRAGKRCTEPRRLWQTGSAVP